MGHRVDGGQNGRMSATELHKGSMRPLTHRHTQLAFAFAIWNPTSQTAMKQSIFMLTAPISSCTHCACETPKSELQPRIYWSWPTIQ